MDSYQARRARVKILYNNIDITEDISQDLISMSWTDKSSGEADSLSIKLQNTHGRWFGDWLPAKGATLEAAIRVENWSGNGEIIELPCGTFQIDEISVTGPPQTAEIKAVSVPITSKSRGQKRTRAWDNVRLSEIAGDISGQAGLSLFFDLPNDPIYEREDQIEETDLAFLQGLAEESGAALKVSHGKLIIFSEKEYEQKDAVLTLDYTDLTRYSLKSKSSGVYGKCKVKYHDPETDEDIEYEEYAELLDLSGTDQNERVMEVNRRAKTLAEAETMAKNMLYEANKYEVSGSISMPGDVRVVAGTNITLTGLGSFGGKYVIDSATHTVSKGYTVSAEIRRAGKRAQAGQGGEDLAEFYRKALYGRL